jgi:CheY-like chemotaxis protein
MRTLLIIDDDVLSRRRLQTLLASAGYRVLLAANGVEGFSLLRTVVIDAILCDLMLPGMPGVQVVHRVRRTPEWQALPLILLHTPQQAYLVPRHAITSSLPVAWTAAAVLMTVAMVLGQHPPAARDENRTDCVGELDANTVDY